MKPAPAHLATALLLAALAAACSGPGSRTAPEVVAPETWGSGGIDEAVSAEPWWLSFDSPGLTAAVEEALRANRELPAAVSRVAQAAALARIAGADDLPAVNATGGWNRQRTVFFGIPGVGGQTFQTYNVGLDVSWELDLWGRLAAGEAAAAADLAASEFGLAAVGHSIAARTARAWLAWQEARAQAALAETTAASFRHSAELVEARYVRGLAPPLDVRLAESNAASAEALVALRREQEQRALRALEVLMGRYPAGDTPLTPLELPDAPELPPAGLPADLIARRPDLAALERNLVAADERFAAARGALYPRISLTGSTGFQSDELGDLLDSDFNVWSLGAGLVQPLFQGGRLRAAVDLEDARIAEAVANLEAGLLQAYAEVETALAIEEHLVAREERLRAASEAATAGRDLAENRYANGIEGLLPVLEAQRRALTNESELLSARRARLDARIDLFLALGGGFVHPDAPDYPNGTTP